MNVGLYLAVILAFAIWLTLHAALCVGILKTSVRKGLVSLLVPPAAAYYGQKQKRLLIAWGSSLFLYLSLLVLGSF